MRKQGAAPTMASHSANRSSAMFLPAKRLTQRPVRCGGLRWVAPDTLASTVGRRGPRCEANEGQQRRPLGLGAAALLRPTTCRLTPTQLLELKIVPQLVEPGVARVAEQRRPQYVAGFRLPALLP